MPTPNRRRIYDNQGARRATQIEVTFGAMGEAFTKRLYSAAEYGRLLNTIHEQPELKRVASILESIDQRLKPIFQKA